MTPEAGDQLKPPVAGIDTQNNPRLFFLLSVSVLSLAER